MEEGAEPPACPVCETFEPQAWRKSLCRNCFKTFEQHDEQLESSATSPDGDGGGGGGGGGGSSSAPAAAASAKGKYAAAAASPGAAKKAEVKDATGSIGAKDSSAQKSTDKSHSSSSSSTAATSSTSSSLSSSKSSSSQSGSSKFSSSTATTTSSTSTATAGGKSLFTSASKAKDFASKFEEKSKTSASSSSASSKTASTTTTTTATTSPTTSSKEPERKSSLVSSLAGKIDSGSSTKGKQPSPDLKSPVESSKPGLGSSTKTTPDSKAGKTTAGAADSKVGSALGKFGADSKVGSAAGKFGGSATAADSKGKLGTTDSKRTGTDSGSKLRGTTADVSKVGGLVGKLGTTAVDSKSTTNDSKTAAADSSGSKSKAEEAEKKLSGVGVGKAGLGGIKEKGAPFLPSSSSGGGDTSARAKWEKRDAVGPGGGGGGGGGTGIGVTGARSDVTKGSHKGAGEGKDTGKAGAGKDSALHAASSPTATTTTTAATTTPSTTNNTLSAGSSSTTSSAAKNRLVDPGPGADNSSSLSTATTKTASKETTATTTAADTPSTAKKAPWEKDRPSPSATSAAADKSPPSSKLKSTPKFSLPGKSSTSSLASSSASSSSSSKKDAVPLSPTSSSSKTTPPAATATARSTDRKNEDVGSGDVVVGVTTSISSAPTPDTSSSEALKAAEKAVKDLEQKTKRLEKELAEKNEDLRKKLAAKDEELASLKSSRDRKEKEVAELRKKLQETERETKDARKEMEEAKEKVSKEQKKEKSKQEEMEQSLTDLHTQVKGLEDQCSKLESENEELLTKLKDKERPISWADESPAGHGESGTEEAMLQMEEIELREENMELRQQLLDLRREMDEMYDTFRENELDEFRELQRELDIASKQVRVLQFKLRKADRKSEQVDNDRQHYEEKIRNLQMQIESGDARAHIEALEEELRTAKEVSVRLHDELDMMEDRRNKALEDNRHLTGLLEQTDKKQFRMEMEIDKLRDQIVDLKQQLRERSPSRKEGTPDRRDVLGRQGSQEYDCAQLMRDLCDSVERETDLKEQLKFLEEESRMLRKKLAEMEDENEALRVQLKKLSLKASRWKEEIEGRDQLRKREDVGQERERLDSSDDETSVVTLKLQMALLEQELMTSQRGQAESEREIEMLKAEVASLRQRLKEQEQEMSSLREQHAPTAPDTYYEEKVRELTEMADELRWRIIEKDREIERLSTASMAHARHHVAHGSHGSSHHGHHGHGSRGEGKRGQLKKSRSLDSDPHAEELKRQLEVVHHEVACLRNQASLLREQREDSEKETRLLRQQLAKLQQEQQQQQPPPVQKLQQQQQQQQQTGTVPLVQADDAAVENIELRDAVKRSQEEARVLREQVRTLTDKLHALSRAAAVPPPSSPTTTTPRLATATAATAPITPECLSADTSTPTTSSTTVAAVTTTTITTSGTSLPSSPQRLPRASEISTSPPSTTTTTTTTTTLPPSSPSHRASIPHVPAAAMEEGGRGEGEEEEAASARDLHERLLSREEKKKASRDEEETEAAVVVLLREEEKEGGGDGFTVAPAASAAAAEEEVVDVVVGGEEIEKGDRKLYPRRGKAVSARSGAASGSIGSGGGSKISGNDDDKNNMAERQSPSTSPGDAIITVDIPSSFEAEKEGVPGGRRGDGGGKAGDDGVDIGGLTKTGKDTVVTGGGGGVVVAGAGRGQRDSLERKGVVVVSVDEGESREALMDKILDMEDELNDLLQSVKRLQEENDVKSREIKSLKVELQDAQDVGRKTELQLLQELDMLHDKNSVLSNLLEIIHERASNAERELERHLQESSAPSTRSASAVSQVSALSDASCGSDEVFMSPPHSVPGEKGQVIQRDWEAKLKNRIESLERLLAEERQKVSTAEKKLNLSAEQGLAPSLSDDVKLRLREKELLQEELTENQRHLRVATDQIQGMRERLHALEEEHHRLKVDYGRLCNELDRRELDSDVTDQDSDKTPENSVEPEEALVAKRLARLNTGGAAPSKTTDPDTTTKTDSKPDKTTGGAAATSADQVTLLQNELARYTLKAEQLEYKVEEISDIWRSKNAATEREKSVLDTRLKEKTHEMSELHETMDRLQEELKVQTAALAQAERKAEHLQEEVARRQSAEHELHEVLTQATERQQTLKQLRDTVSARDERLKEKDDIIHYLNSLLEQRQAEIQDLQQRVADMTSQIAKLPPTSSQDMSPVKEAGGETDVEKENTRLREKTRSLRAELEQGDATRKQLENSRRSLEEASLSREREKAELQASLNVAEEKIRLYETLSSVPSDSAAALFKKDSLQYFEEKEALAVEVTSLHHELATCQRNALETTSRLSREVNVQKQRLQEEFEANKLLQPELDRLRAQAERAFRLQQEERQLRAELQAVKQRYESRVSTMSQEYSTLVVTMQALQKEKAADREMMAGIQKAMALIKEAHAQDHQRWEEEKARLDKQIKGLSETRELVGQMQQKMSEMREALGQQERSRADVINKYSTDRAAWEIDKANLQSEINQLQEQLKRTKKDSGSSVALETAWAKERAQQQRLLSEAHALALDLQKQLALRNQEAEQSQRRLAEQLDRERKAFDKERKDRDKQVAELEGRVRWQGTLQRKVLDVQEAADRQLQQARAERAEMTKRLVETRQQHARDARAVHDVMTGLVKLRDLGATLRSQEPAKGGHPEMDNEILNYTKEAMVQISTAADQLSKHTGGNGSSEIRRSLSSSELEILREELNDLRKEGGDVFPSIDVIATPTTSASSSLRSQPPPLRSSSLDRHHYVQSDHAPLPSILRPSRQTPSNAPPHHGAPASSSSSSRATDFSLSRRFLESSPSPASGVGSQQRKTSEERQHPPTEKPHPPFGKESSPKPHQGTGPKPQWTGTKQQQDASADDKQKRFSSARSATASAAIGPTSASTATTTTATTTATTTSTVSSSSSSKPSRPRTLTKSLSVDSQPTWAPGPYHSRSHSASTTPTQPEPAPGATPTDAEGGSPSLRTVRRRIGGLSPRTARKKFFEESPADKAGFLSWPERGRKGGGGGGAPLRDPRAHGGVDPREMRRGAEQEHEWLLSRVLEVPAHSSHALKTSASYDEKMHHRVGTTPTEAGHSPKLFAERRVMATEAAPPAPAMSTEASGAVAEPQESQAASGKGGQPTTSAKDRRRLFKKSSSLDSSVGTCIARAGMTTLMSPAAPSAFSPSDFLATIKGKLAPAFGRKSKEEERPPSPLFIPTTVPDIPLRPSAATTTTTSTTTTTTTTTSATSSGAAPAEQSIPSDTQTSKAHREDSRGRGFSRRQDALHQTGSSLDSHDVRWRSMSADRATRPLLVHTDVIVPSQVWQFSETAV